MSILQHKCSPIRKKLDYLEIFIFRLASNPMTVNEHSPACPSTQPHIAGSLANLFDISEGVQEFGVGRISTWTSAALKPAIVGVGKISRDALPNLMLRKQNTTEGKYSPVKAIIVGKQGDRQSF